MAGSITSALSIVGKNAGFESFSIHSFFIIFFRNWFLQIS